MKNNRLFNDYLEDMVEACQKALRFTSGMTREDFDEDEKTQFAVIRSLEIIGDAAKKIPMEVKDNYPEIPWREITGMRDKVFYFTSILRILRVIVFPAAAGNW